MATLTGCIRKAGAALQADDKDAILERFNALTQSGVASAEAARQAIDERIAAVREMLAAAGSPKMPTQQADSMRKAPEGERAPATPSAVENFGEALPPARRNMAAKLTEDLTNDDIASRPFSEVWPLAENEAIEDPFAAAVAHAARAEVPAKPRVPYKLREWVKKVQMLRDLAGKIVGGTITRERMGQRIEREFPALRDWWTKVQLLESLPRDQWKRIGTVEERPEARMMRAGEFVPNPMLRLEMDGASKWLTGDQGVEGKARGTVAGNRKAITALLTAAEPEQRMEFSIYERRKDGSIFVAKKGDPEKRELMTFADAKEARKAINEQYDSLVAAWEAVKARDNITERDLRSAENRPRVGKDYRKGRDITVDEFQSVFGFRGGEFGKWVQQGKGDKDRQALLNNTHDALMDLAAILNVPPRAMSLNGTLGIALGSRGSGWASAHFEPSNLVINLTKTRGAGSLAHEWFHALDNYFSRLRRNGAEAPMTGSQNQYRDDNFITHRPEPLMVNKSGRWPPMTRGKLEAYRASNPKSGYLAPENWMPDPKHPTGVRPEVEQRFADLVKALNDSPMAKRAALLDKGGGYWSRTLELAARAFESHVIAKMHEQGFHNDFLVNVKKLEETGKADARYPYLLAGEVKPIAEAFDALFATVETRTDDSGNVALYEPEPAPYTESDYEQDLFGDPIQPPAGRPARSRANRTGVRGNAQPTAAVPGDTEAPAGDYLVRTVVGVTQNRTLGAAVINTAADAAAATRYLYRSAVERFDGIVTDKNGKPLAVVGGFKGALTQASVYPSTIVAEAMRVPGAANIWFSHNHPSGKAELSRADESINRMLSDVFEGTGITPRGLIAVAGNRYASVAPFNGAMPVGSQPVPDNATTATVPVVERELVASADARPDASGIKEVKALAASLYGAAKAPGLMLLDSQYRLAAWVPMTPEMQGPLRNTGGLRALYRAVSESNAGASVIVHGGELDSMPLVRGQIGAAQNIGAALHKIDVRPLDVVNAVTGETYAEQGRLMYGGPVFSRDPAERVELEASDAVGREFWRKIDNGESFTEQEVLDALAINRRGSRRVARGVAATADQSGTGVATIRWQGDLASLGPYTSRANWDGDNFNVFFVPDSLAQDADLNDYDQARDRAVVHVSFKSAPDGRYEISFNDPPAGSTAIRAAEAAGVAARAGTESNEYRRVRLGDGNVTSRDITQEAIRRLALNIGQTPAVFYPRRDTGARAGQANTGRDFAADDIRQRMSRDTGLRMGGVPMNDAEGVVAAIRELLPNAPQIILHAKLSEAPKALRDDIRAAGAEMDVEAAYHDGRIHVFPKNIKTVERMRFVVAHHEIRHHGLRSMFGTGDLFKRVMLGMWDTNPKLREAAQAKMDARLAESRVEGVEEALADMPVDEALKLNGFQRVIAAVRRWLRATASKLRGARLMTLADAIDPARWTDNDVAALVLKAEDVSRSGGNSFLAGGMAFGRNASPVFYSPLQRAVLNAPANAMPASGWASWLKGQVANGKVKADEVEWSGINDWLGMQQGKVTRGAVADYLQGNGVRVTETVLGAPQDAAAAQWWTVDAYGNEFGPFATEEEAEADRQKQIQEFISQGAGEAWAESEAVQVERRQPESPDSETKYANYTLPGGTNYREVLLTLPTGGPSTLEAMSDAELRALILRNDDNADVDGVSRPYLMAMIRSMELGSSDLAKLTGKNTAQYKSRHWDQPNVIAHIRVNDRTDADGKRVLFVEELQSDWAQEGRKQGPAPQPPQPVEALPATAKAVPFTSGGRTEWFVEGVPEFGSRTSLGWPSKESALAQALLSLNQKRQAEYNLAMKARLLRAPFVDKTDKWLALALKRIVKMATDEGYDRVAFVTGEQSADRYDLSKHVGRVEWITPPVSAKGSQAQQPSLGRLKAYDINGSGAVIDKEIAADELGDHVGKEVADRLLSTSPQSSTSYGHDVRTVMGDGLKVGGEGMIAFYDKIVPAAAKEVLRKMGGGALSRIGEVSQPDNAVEQYLNLGQGREASVAALKPVVDAGMVAALQNDKVAQIVVQALPVNVMNVLSAQGVSAQEFVRDPKVLLAKLPVDRGLSVANGLRDALSESGALLGAGLDAAYKARLDQEIAPALRASELDTKQALGLLLGRHSGSTAAGARAETSGGPVRRTGVEFSAAERAAFERWHAQIVPHGGGDVLRGALSFDITPAMREQAAGGVPLFSRRSDAETRFSRAAAAEPADADNDVEAPETRTAQTLLDGAPVMPRNERARSAFRNAIDKTRPFWLGTFTRDQIADVWGKEIPQVAEYDRLTRAMENERQSEAQKADDIYQRWAKIDSAENDVLARVMLDATVHQVHPDQEAAPDGATAIARAVHKRIRRQFQELSPEARAIYAEVRDYHANTLTRLRTAIERRIERALADGGERRAMLDDLRMKFDQYLQGGPYFPLHRFGDFLVIATKPGPENADGTPGPVERVVAAYENPGEQRLAAAELERQGFAVKLRAAKSYNREKDGSAGAFVGEMLKLIEKADMPDANVGGMTVDLKAKLMDDLNQLFIRALPDLSYRKHFTHRKNVPGFSADVLRGFASSAFHSAAHIARINHGDKMTFELQEAEKAVNDAPEGDFTEATQVIEELARRHEVMLNPDAHPASVAATSLGFVLHLGLSPAAGLINMLQVPMVSIPYLGARYGFAKATAAMAKAYNDIRQAKPTWKSGFDAATSPAVSADERKMLMTLQDEGVIDLTQAHDLAGATALDTGNQAKSKASFAIARAMKIVGWTFHVPEVVNRQATALMAYRLASRAGASPEAAADAAREAIKRTQFDYAQSNTARYMQGNWMRVLTQFKKFSQNMTYFLGRAAYQALKGEDPMVRKIARRQLLSTFAVTGMFAGTMGLPVVGFLGGLLESLVSAMSDDEEPWDWKTEYRNMLADAVGKDAAEVMAKGLPRALMPWWDIADRVSLNDLWWRSTDQAGASPQEAWANAVAQILGPSIGWSLSWYTAADHMARGNYVKGFEAVVPKFIRDPVRAVREGVEGVTTYTGEPLTPTTLDENISRALGFASPRITEMQAGRRAVTTAKTAIEERRRVLLTQIAQARLAGDAAEVLELRRKIDAFNQRNPEFRITTASIVRATNNRRRNRDAMEDGIVLPRGQESLRDIGRFANVQ